MQGVDMDHILGQMGLYHVEKFYEAMAKLWWTADYAERKYGTVERMLSEPLDALKYCDTLRKQFNVPELRNPDILFTLINKRKYGYIKAMKPDETKIPC